MTEPQPPRVVAVVVTFNRLALLRRLVSRLREVPEVAEVVVVDNSSSDGTGEWLAGLGGDGPPVVGRTLDRNTGGAGGFHAARRCSISAARRMP